MENQNKTMEKFIAQAGISFELSRRDSNPFMGDRDMFHYTARLVRHGVVMETPFSTGTGWTKQPSLSDVLNCLASDASCIDSAPDFETFCADLGYDSDSRKAEKIYEACKLIQQELKRLLGSELYQELVFETERL